RSPDHHPWSPESSGKRSDQPSPPPSSFRCCSHALRKDRERAAIRRTASPSKWRAYASSEQHLLQPCARRDHGKIVLLEWNHYVHHNHPAGREALLKNGPQMVRPGRAESYCPIGFGQPNEIGGPLQVHGRVHAIIE